MKILVIEKNGKLTADFKKNLIKSIEIIGVAKPGLASSDAIMALKPDFLMVNCDTFLQSYISARTHQGIQKLSLDQVVYFKAEHKYVIAYHDDGELLIDNSLSSLEKEFNTDFVRIHRNTLVSYKYIEELLKKESGQYYVKLRKRSEELLVSRRKVSLVRRIIKDHANYSF